MARFFGILSGLTGFGLLALFFVFLDWKEEAKEHKKVIESNLEYYTQQWQKRSGLFSIQYEAIDIAGFPFEQEVRLYKPRIQFTSDDEIVQLSSLLITFKPIGTPKGETMLWKYKVEFPLEVVCGIKPHSQPQRNFMVHLSDLPELYLQAHSTTRDGHFDEYGVLMPEKFMLTVNRDQVARSHNMTFAPQEKPNWSYIPNELHSTVVHFFHALENSLVAPVEPPR